MADRGGIGIRRVNLAPRDPATFRAHPTGSFVAGERWAYFCVDPNLYGYAIWGAPLADDIAALVRTLVEELERPLHAALVDLEHLEAVTAEPFDALARYVIEHDRSLARVVRHAAIVRPRRRVVAALVAGFFEVSSRPFPFSLWESKDAALASLGRPDAAVVARAIDDLRARVSGEPAIVRRVRATIAARPATARLQDAARDAGVSVRTLQRRLSEYGTTFEAELLEVRLDIAMRRLRESDVPVTTIALDVGFATPQHFASLFRKWTGTTPSRWRGKHRVART